jgi:hypothetical protein
MNIEDWREEIDKIDGELRESAEGVRVLGHYPSAKTLTEARPSGRA